MIGLIGRGLWSPRPRDFRPCFPAPRADGAGWSLVVFAILLPALLLGIGLLVTRFQRAARR
jgi:uncharacterized RDD family membrane protein YckC